jgi:hypothetical protein
MIPKNHNFEPNGYATMNTHQFSKLERLMWSDPLAVDQHLRGFEVTKQPPQWLVELPNRIGAASIMWCGVAYLRKPEYGFRDENQE